MISVALCITHAEHDERRRTSMDRLRQQLRLGDIVQHDDDFAEVTVPVFGRILYREERDRAPHHVWSERQWTWGTHTGAEWVLYLQDDVIVAPDFWERLEHVFDGLPNDYWLSFLTNHWGSRGVYLAGNSGYMTVDGIVGNGYAASPAELVALLAWRKLEIVPGMAERLPEDVLIALYCMARDRRIYTPLPGLIDHDLDVGTLHAEEHGANRRAYVRWDDEDRLGPNGQHERTQFLGRFYETAHTMLPGVLTDSMKGVELARKYEPMRCPPQFGQYFEMIVPVKEWP